MKHCRRWTVSVALALKWQWKGNEGVEQTYLSSGAWAAMRDRRLLSARGHPDRLREKEKERRTDRGRGENKEGGARGVRVLKRREERKMWVKGNQECKAYQGHLGRRGQTARSKLLMHIKVNDRLCFPSSRYIIASGMSGSNKIFELVLVCLLWTLCSRGRVCVELTFYVRALAPYQISLQYLRWDA